MCPGVHLSPVGFEIKIPFGGPSFTNPFFNIFQWIPRAWHTPSAAQPKSYLLGTAQRYTMWSQWIFITPSTNLQSAHTTNKQIHLGCPKLRDAWPRCESFLELSHSYQGKQSAGCFRLWLGYRTQPFQLLVSNGAILPTSFDLEKNRSQQWSN